MITKEELESIGFYNNYNKVSFYFNNENFLFSISDNTLYIVDEINGADEPIGKFYNIEDLKQTLYSIYSMDMTINEFFEYMKD